MANLCDSYTGYDADDAIYVTVREQFGQSFTGNGETLDNVIFRLYKAGSPTGSCYAKVFAHTGTFGDSSEPTGAVLATSDAYDVSTIGGGGEITFTFSGANRITLTNATKFCVLFEYTGGDASNAPNIGYDGSSPTHGGNAFAYRYGSYTLYSGRDTYFKVYTVASASTIPGNRPLGMKKGLQRKVVTTG